MINNLHDTMPVHLLYSIVFGFQGDNNSRKQVNVNVSTPRTTNINVAFHVPGNSGVTQITFCPRDCWHRTVRPNLTEPTSKNKKPI